MSCVTVTILSSMGAHRILRVYCLYGLISHIIVTEMSSSDKMTNALLAMSLSYYYVMEEQMKMEKKADKMLSTLLTCHGNNVPPKHITSVQCKTI